MTMPMSATVVTKLSIPSKKKAARHGARQTSPPARAGEKPSELRPECTANYNMRTVKCEGLRRRGELPRSFGECSADSELPECRMHARASYSTRGHNACFDHQCLCATRVRGVNHRTQRLHRCADGASTRGLISSSQPNLAATAMRCEQWGDHAAARILRNCGS